MNDPSVFAFFMPAYSGGVIAKNSQEATGNAIKIVVQNLLEGKIELCCGDLEKVSSEVEDFSKADFVNSLRKTYEQTCSFHSRLTQPLFSEDLVRKLNGVDRI